MAVLGALVGSSLLFCASASAKTAPELALTVTGVGPPGYTLVPSMGFAVATQVPAGTGEVREVISIVSATPSVCTILGYVWGSGEEPPPEGQMAARVWFLAGGTCTVVASVKATNATEAAEVSDSIDAAATPVQTPPAPTLPEITLGETRPERTEEERAEGPPVVYLPSSFQKETYSTRPGLSVSSATPSVCTVSSLTSKFEVEVRLVATGTCTITASLPKTSEHEAVDVTKTFFVKAEDERPKVEPPPSLVLPVKEPAVGPTHEEEEEAAAKKRLEEAAANEHHAEAGAKKREEEDAPAKRRIGQARVTKKQEEQTAKKKGAKEPHWLCLAKASKCATLIFHTYGGGGPHAEGPEPTNFKVWVCKLGPHGQVVGRIGTYKHRLRVAPGRYKVQGGTSRGEIVEISVGRTREVTLNVNEK